MSETGRISAILLAAGKSRRMGQPKLLLPWGTTTVLGQVVATFAAAGIGDLVVVTGGARRRVEALVADLAGRYPVRSVYNPEHERGEMLSSIQAGLAALGPEPRAALIGLGDQPQVQMETIRRLCAAFERTGTPLVFPSFDNHRGHPWLAGRAFWPEILALPLGTNPRQFITAYAGPIGYVEADESILRDLDTPEDYALQRP
ncbi:MAG TPA: nucleotidyltransferase family protein [Anaerolineales bacterium]|nr:nucleotidyltransferase family protein [Anaerolineales bacterium]